MVSDHDDIPQHCFGYYKPLPFKLYFAIEGTDVRIELDFLEHQNNSSLNRFIRVWSSWLTLAQQGAFADEHAPPERNHLLVSEHPSSWSRGMVFTHERVNICSGGFFSFINLMDHKPHLEVANIEEVRIF